MFSRSLSGSAKVNSNIKLMASLFCCVFLVACGGGAGSEEEIKTPSNVESQTGNNESTQPIEEVVAEVQITTQPQSITLDEGNNASFSVAANGGGSLSFQWRKAGQVIQGATNSTLTLSSVTSADAGLYDVVVANSAGQKVSLSALLTVNEILVPIVAPVVILEQPANVTVDESNNVSFSVAVTGDGEITYQWLKNGDIIDGANSANLNLSSVSESDAGNYSVIVSNSQGPVVSDAASLSVIAAPVITSVELNWDIPVAREDGADLALGEINGYVIVYGTDENNLSSQLVVEGASVTTALVENLAPGTYYFAIATVDSDGVQGQYSGVINQTI